MTIDELVQRVGVPGRTNREYQTMRVGFLGEFDLGGVIDADARAWNIDLRARHGVAVVLGR